MMSIGIFGFQALWSPFFLGFLFFVTFLYFSFFTKWRNKFEESEPLSKRQALLFNCAMAILYAVKGSPPDVMGHIMLS